MRTDRHSLSKHGVVLSFAIAILAGCTFQAAAPPPSSPNTASGSQNTPTSVPESNADAAVLSAALNATLDPGIDPLAALDLPPTENSGNLEFVTVYMMGGRKLSFATFPRFGEGYLDEHGYVWSKHLRQTANGTYREAVEACAAVGGVLPYSGGAWWQVFPTYSADGKTELVAGLSQTVIPLTPPGHPDLTFVSYDGRTGKTIYSSTNSKDVLCIMEYKGRSK